MRDELDSYWLEALRRLRKWDEPWSIYLAALAMESGARLTSSFKRDLLLRLKDEDYLANERGIYPPAQRQMRKALAEYPNDGTPWIFGGLGLLHTMSAHSFVERKHPASADRSENEELVRQQKDVQAELDGEADPGMPDPDVAKTTLPGKGEISCGKRVAHG